jgi:hypothetical protein
VGLELLVVTKWGSLSTVLLECRKHSFTLTALEPLRAIFFAFLPLSA